MATENVENTSTSGITPDPTSANATTAGNNAATNSGVGYTSATQVNSMEELKLKAPKLYNQMMVGIATAICRDSQDHTRRLKEAMRRGRQG
ncbi:MAG: hypothetical protein H0X51_09870 [Parachlamydiaceae bacterium]|nr:hypothetical protein [Parachlamydiaceae bacterium]